MLFEETELSNDDDDDDDDDDNHTQFCNNTAKNSEQYSQNKLGSLATHVEIVFNRLALYQLEFLTTLCSFRMLSFIIPERPHKKRE